MMIDTQASPDQLVADDAATSDPVAVASGARDDRVRRFRASTYDDALAAAIDELGPDVEVLEANRIRRGGLGGFFATDLGVEIAVVTSTAAPASTAATAATAVGGALDATPTMPVRPFLPEDLTAGLTGGPASGREDGSLPGQSLGLTDAGLRQLLARVEEVDQEDHHVPARSAADARSFADHLATELGGPGHRGGAERLAKQLSPGLGDDLAGRVAQRLADDDASASAIVEAIEPSAATADAAAIEPPGDGSFVDLVDAIDSVEAGAGAPSLPPRSDRAVARSAPAGFLHEDRIGAELPSDLGAEDDRFVAVVVPMPHSLADAEAEPDTPAADHDPAGVDPIEPMLDPVGGVVDPAELVAEPVAGTIDAVEPDASTTDLAELVAEPVAGTIDAVEPDASTTDLAELVAEPVAGTIDAVEPDASTTDLAEVDGGAVDEVFVGDLADGTAGADDAVDPESMVLAGRLIADATDRLVGELGRMAVADGSPLHDLDRLRVAVTTPAGMRVEMAVELATGNGGR